MLHTTRAIVLKTIRHGDNTIVLKALTQALGTRSILVRTGRKGGVTGASLQPLSRLEVVLRESAERELLTLQELRVAEPYESLPFDAVRGTLALFVQEILYRTLHGESADAELYAFVEEALRAMDCAPDVSHFPLVLLVRYSEVLGFLPAAPGPDERWFDLLEGEFMVQGLRYGHLMGPPLSDHLAALLPVGFDQLSDLGIPADERRELLDRLLLYFRMHVEGLGEIRSPAILHDVLG